MPDETKKTRFPTEAADWDPRTRLRFLAGFCGLLDKVPEVLRPQVFADCTAEMARLQRVPEGQPHATVL
jgi:hypothetical protein